MFKIIVSLFLACTINFSKELNTKDYFVENDFYLKEFSELIRNEITLTGNHFLDAIAIRDFVHKKVPLGKNPKNFNNDSLKDYYEAFKNNQTFMCGGISTIYLIALKSVGIEARLVNLSTDNKEPYDSHVSVEFYDGSKWIASDPTFNNLFFNLDKQFVSFEDVIELKKNGLKVDYIYHFETKSTRKLENYYVSLDKLLNYVWIHPSKNGKKFVFPENWNTIIKIKNKDYNVFNLIRNGGGYLLVPEPKINYV